jgi:putative aldouronate transport system substrate-binding protein
MFRKLEPISVNDFWAPFLEEYDSYSAERAALNQVAEQYLKPIQAGIVPDVDAAIKLLIQKGTEAGRDKVYDSFVMQWKVYCNQKGLN